MKKIIFFFTLKFQKSCWYFYRVIFLNIASEFLKPWWLRLWISSFTKLKPFIFNETKWIFRYQLKWNCVNEFSKWNLCDFNLQFDVICKYLFISKVKYIIKRNESNWMTTVEMHYENNSNQSQKRNDFG